MFVYHKQPEPLVGEQLLPLSSLKQTYPELHSRELAKYQDHPSRLTLPERWIPRLECRWQDVVQFSPAHPHLIVAAWHNLGVALPDARFLRIPVTALKVVPTVVVERRGHNPSLPILHSEVQWLDTASYLELAALPTATLDWYQELHARGRRGAWWVGVPHIMAAGPVNIREAEVISWLDPPRL